MGSSERPTVVEYRNIAGDDANVDAQIGVIHGDVNIGLASLTPAEKANHGEKLLGRGSSREAEQVLGDAIGEGYSGSRVAYYWALATLAGRSWNQLEAHHQRNLHEAFRMVPSGVTDSWAQALSVVEGLVGLLQAADDQRIGTTDEQEKVLAAYDRLDPERSAEILRYLDQVLDGVVLEHIDRAAAAEVADSRLANGRAERSWMFFEPDPARPEPIPPPPRPRPLWSWLKLASGVAAGVMGAVPVTPLLIRGGAPWPALVLIVVGLSGSVYFGVWCRYVLHEREVEERMFTAPMVDGLPWTPEGQARFTEMVVEGAFNKCAPADPVEKQRWKRATREYRLNLTRQFFEVYREPTVQRRPSVVRWLARWHAEQLADRWDPEHPSALYDRIRVPGWMYLAMVGPAALTAVGAAWLWRPLATYGVFADYVVFPILLLIGARVAFDQGCGLISSVRARDREEEASDHRHRQELAVHQRLCDRLLDRPDDAQMAMWLDHDQRYLRSVAMKMYQVTIPDLINHITFCAPTATARNAREIGGTKRYTEYAVGILLMTRTGVRFAEFRLDMRTGKVQEPERLSFRYDKVASVHVKTVRADHDHPFGPGSKKSGSDETEDPKDSTEEERPMHRPGLRTIFQIVLVNREWPIEAIFDLFDDEITETQEQAHELVARALDVSGVAGALWMMEAITADGSDWVDDRERQVRRRRHRPARRARTEIGSEFNGTGNAVGTEAVRR